MLRSRLLRPVFVALGLAMLVQVGLAVWLMRASVDEMVKLLRKKGEPVFEAVAAKGIGVFETLKGVAKLVLQELTKTG